MRILAVIPACEGSATLPNKNMRVLHGKPLVYYAISNAVCSKHITDVIVTTNSREIITLAKQMRVMTRLRDPKLCNQCVSLDAVVYDVFNQLDINDYDYVVTMQSISPTLRTNTLDDAFDRYFREELDTLISVKNQAQFYWEVNGGKPAPLQRCRMNRHMLPPFYAETGAFLITKATDVQENTRIGEKVGLYELSGDEAIDVNSFGDLRQAENALNRQSTAIFVNGNGAIGMGHISRVMQIADELFTKPDIYFDCQQTEPGVFGHTDYNIIPVNGTEEFVRRVSCRHYEAIINDILNTTEDFMSALKKAAPDSRIINFEDDGDGARYADIVVNALYETGEHKNVWVGSKYYILPKLFLLYEPIEIKEQTQDILISFGGADPQGYTDIVLEFAARPEYSHFHFFVVLGKAKKNVEKLMQYGDCPNITIMYDIDNMPEIMSKCDVAISSRGRTCFELAALGIPTLSIPQHTREEKHSFVCKENGFMCLGTSPEKSDVEAHFRKIILSDKVMRTEMQQRMLKNDLRNGRKNVTDLIYGE